MKIFVKVLHYNKKRINTISRKTNTIFIQLFGCELIVPTYPNWYLWKHLYCYFKKKNSTIIVEVEGLSQIILLSKFSFGPLIIVCHVLVDNVFKSYISSNSRGNLLLAI